MVSTTAEHPFMVEGLGWIHAEYLQPGQHLVTETGTARLDAVEVERPDVPVTVYNIHVDNNHNYYVVAGHDIVLAHNAKHAGPHGTYEPNPKHGRNQRGNAAPEPADGQAALDVSHPIKPTTTRRVAVDKLNEEFVVLDETFDDSKIFHGHVREWKGKPGQEGLTDQMKNALIRSGDVTRKGKIK